MKLKEMLRDGYIMGLKTLNEAFFSIHRNSHLYFRDDREELELAELERQLDSYTGDELITDILTKDEMNKIDKQLEEDLR